MLDVETLLRIEVNMAMEQDREIFMAQWNKLGVIIYDFANEQGDDFNKLYERKERQQERRGST